MRRLRFRKRDTTVDGEQTGPSAIHKFGIQPRTETGAGQLPDDPELAHRVSALRKRRETLLNELRLAEDARQPDNQWRRQIALINEALESVERDRAALRDVRRAPGAPLPPTPVADVAVVTQPVAAVRFRVGDTQFVYTEEMDWAERGTQIARSELQREKGEVEALVSADFPADQRSALIAHLEGSLFVFASDLRDRALESQPFPAATLADLAKPSPEHGGWLDWAGHSPAAQTIQFDLIRLRAEQERLESEQASLLDEEAKLVDAIPVIRRRLQDTEQQLAALSDQS